ncbi:zinc finger protein 638 isoform X3 [Alligator mississippiensis]|uniref:zinc finger protein 638 isoform X3 n=1 Tax=Alligator mississippiensis TaxID=8496 RepID=UPI002877CDDF|nr:zinc finger protein 638 isoform X3 [Alligator mississippiensis]
MRGDRPPLPDPGYAPAGGNGGARGRPGPGRGVNRLRGSLRSFVLFLESFAPLVNSLNLGIASPFLLGPPPLQLAQIKTQLALQQLTSVASSNSAPPYALLNQAFLKIAMFGPRGTLPPRPRGPNPSGTNRPGAYRGGGVGGLQREPAPGTPCGIPQRYGGQEGLQHPAAQRTNVQVTHHRTDPRQVKENTNLQEEQKEKVRASRWDNSPHSSGTTGQKQAGSSQMTAQNTNVQSRYTTESASSILASFGLSNEDLEELSRYPDDQLTPENMPLILRDIRMRKMGRQLPNVHSQSRGKEPVGGTSGSAIKSKVIEYGHASKYEYTEDPLEVRTYNPEVPTEESRKEFQPQQVGVPPSNVARNQMFPVEDVMKQIGFQSDSSNTQSYFSAENTSQIPGLSVTPGLSMPKPMAQQVMPPMMPPVAQSVVPSMMPRMPQSVMPPMMPPGMPPMTQSVGLPSVQSSMAQPVMPPVTQPHFSADLLASVSQHERIQHESGINQSSAQSGPVAGQKSFQSQAEGPIQSPFGVVKASWLPVFSQANAQKIKRLPTPSMMNDYYATSPRIFPHMCSLCNIECTHMKDWIQHQNNPAHLESCRQLRQQYPDWNPEAFSSERNAGERKENQTPKGRSNSASLSPRRSRGSVSRHSFRRSRSRSRSWSPGRPRPARPRSRSPRQIRRLSPRHRSRSPRSRNPLRSSPRPQRSASNEWASRRTTRSPEFNKHKSFQAAGQGCSGMGKMPLPRGLSEIGKMPGNMKKPPTASGSQKTLKKDLCSLPSSAASKMKSGTAEMSERTGMDVDGENAPGGTSDPRPVPYNRLLRDKLLSCGTVLHISDLPDDGFSDQDIKKIVQPFGKVSDLLVLRSRNEAFLEMNYKEAVIAAVKYGETVPVVVNGRRVKINVAEKPKPASVPVKVTIKKTPENVKKAPPNTKKDGNKTTVKITKTTTVKYNEKKTVDPKKSVGHEKKHGEPKKKAAEGKIVEGKKIAEAKKPGEGKKIAEAKKPGEGKPGEGKKIAEAKKPGEGMKIAEAKKPGEGKPGEGKKTAEAKKPGEGMKIAEAKKPGEGKKIAEAKKPGEGKKAAEAKKPEEGKKVVETKKVVEGKKAAEIKAAAETNPKETSKPAAMPEQIVQSPVVVAESDKSKETITNKENLEAKVSIEMKPAESIKKENASEATAETTKKEEPPEPASTDLDDMCVVLISNLPEKGYSVEEVSNLAKPFGGLKDVLILSSHKKAYLEINRKSADSMVKFYTCFPMSVEGNQLCINMVPEYKNIKDEEAIFISMIKDTNSKENTETLHNQFVHLGNLPDDGYTELEVVCVGLRFGKVDHYIVLKNKKKAILQLDSPESAKSMYCFLKQYPYNMGENTLTCTLSPKRDPAESEVKKEVMKEEPVKGSSDLKQYPEGSGVVQTEAANPPVEPSVAKEETISNFNVKAEMSSMQIEASEAKLETTVRDSATKPLEVEASQGESEVVAVTVSASQTADTELPKVKSEESLLPPSSLQKEGVVKDHSKTESLEPAIVTVAESEAKVKPEALPVSAGEPSEELSSACKRGDVQSETGVKPAAVEKTGSVSEAVPSDFAAPSVEMVSADTIQPSNELDASEKSWLTDAVETKAKTPVTQAGVAIEKKCGKPAAEPGTTMEKKLEKLVAKDGTDAEKKLEKSVTRSGEDAENAEKNVANEKNERTLTKAHPNKGAGQAKSGETSKGNTVAAMSVSVKDPSAVRKMILKAVVSIPDISKSRVMVQRKETSLSKPEEQKASSKPETRSRESAEKKHASKDVGHPRPTNSSSCLPDSSSKSKLNISSAVEKGGSGRSSSQQDKDAKVESRGSSKQSQERESRSSSMKKDNSSNKASADRNSRSSKNSASSSSKQKEEEELFPFNLDEFVTVDEVVEELDSPVQIKRNPSGGKRKDSAKNPFEPSSKKRKGKVSVAHVAESELSFVTLDEIGEEDLTAQVVGDSTLEAVTDPQGLVTVDEVNEEEELILEAVKDPQSLLTLDEISEQEEPSSLKDVSGSVFEEQDLLKEEPLVTVDEIGEVEELPLNELSGVNIDETLHHKEEKEAVGDPGDFTSSQLPEDPSALVTVDEIQEDGDDQPLVILDEVTEDDEDFLADFNRLKEELNFVTVDEVGEEDEEEEENPSVKKNLEEADEDEDIVAVAGPEEMDIMADMRSEEEDAAANPKGEEKKVPEADVQNVEKALLADSQEGGKEVLAADTEAKKVIAKEKETESEQQSTGELGLGDTEPETKRRKTDSSDKSKASCTPKDLDFLIPKAGYFCQICSQFYADETSMKNHCQTQRHQQNMEKFMATQKQEENNEGTGEEISTR